YAWVMHNAALMREGRLAELDTDHLAEEIEDMGKSEKGELISRLTVLLCHLLKWKFQPTLRDHSWKYTIKEQRIRTLERLEDSPSLKYELEKKLESAYKLAVLGAAKETSLEEEDFPQKCPFTLAECLDDTFFPDA